MRTPTRASEEPALRYLSLGGGVQSTVLAMLSAAGEIQPGPDLAIFADTGWERAETYEMISWLTEALPYPVKSVSAGERLQDRVSDPVRTTTGGIVATVPMFTIDTRSGSRGIAQRQCTPDFKIAPIERHIRDHLGLRGGQRWPLVEAWLGISVDEINRVKPSRRAAVRNRWPLIEMGWRRSDCEAWWHQNAPRDAPPLARSACVGCPYHSAREWADLTDEEVDELSDLEDAMNAAAEGDPMLRFLHVRRLPIREAVALDREKVAWRARQRTLDFADADADADVDGHGDSAAELECEGVCFS